MGMVFLMEHGEIRALMPRDTRKADTAPLSQGPAGLQGGAHELRYWTRGAKALDVMAPQKGGDSC